MDFLNLYDYATCERDLWRILEQTFLDYLLIPKTLFHSVERLTPRGTILPYTHDTVIQYSYLRPNSAKKILKLDLILGK